MDGSRQKLSPGPERPTYWERFILWLRLPYSVGAWVITGLLAGPVLLVGYVQGGQPPLSAAAFLLYLFSALYMIRYMRVKLVAAEPTLIPLAPEGEETLHRAFGRVSRALPTLVLTAAIVGLFFQGGALPQPQPAEPGLALDALRYVFLSFALGLSFVLQFGILGQFVWVYFSAIRGLHQLGKQPLRLKPFHEDPMLGARPIGVLSLALALAYQTPLGLFALGFFLLDDAPAQTAGAVLLTVLVPLGVVLFFLPLNSTHQQMVQAKQRAQAALRTQFSELWIGSGNPGGEASPGTPSRVERLLMLDMAQRQAAALPTWPFDTRILGRLAAIILSLIAIVLARVVSVALQL